jgi:hypothetical protein
LWEAGRQTRLFFYLIANGIDASASYSAVAESAFLTHTLIRYAAFAVGGVRRPR